MAGDWIKMRQGLLNCPRVGAIARAIGAGLGAPLPRQALRLLAVGGLHAIWSAVNEHSTGGVMAGVVDDLDDLTGLPGIGQAMISVGWLEERDGTLVFPNFSEWNTPGKDRTGAERQRRFREKNAGVTDRNGGVTDRNAVTVTTEKRREREEKEKTEPAAPVATGDQPAAARPRPPAAPKISWTPADGWTGITDDDRRDWAVAYPGAILVRELAKAGEWLKANPTKAGKRNWRAFLVRWLQRCQDAGGTNREPGRAPDASRAAAADDRWRRVDPVVAESERLRREKAARLRQASSGGASDIVADLASSLRAPPDG